MNPVGLHHALLTIHAFQHKWHQRILVLGLKQLEVRFKSPNVFSPVVSRQRDAENGHLAPFGPKSAGDLHKVVPCTLHRHPTQAVIAAQFNQSHFGVHVHGVIDAVQPALGRVSAHACVYDTVLIALGVEQLLQHIRVSLTRFKAEASRDAISKANHHRSSILGRSHRSRLGNVDFRFGLGTFLSATRKSERH